MELHLVRCSGCSSVYSGWSICFGRYCDKLWQVIYCQELMKIQISKKPAVRMCLMVICGCLIWFIAHTVFITLSGLQDNLRPADVVVVLGNEVNSDGQPSDRLKARLDKAVEIFDNGLTGHLIVSGGIGKEGFDEAEVMARYLNDKNIPKESIIVDSEGMTTEATARNAADIMRQNNWHSAIIVSQYFHIARTKLAIEQNGVKEVYWAAANYFEIRDIYSISREFFAYYAYLFR